MAADFTWASDNIIYGMFLSDETIINRMETCLLTYSCMACMGLQGTSKRHLAGLQKHGVGDDDLNAIIRTTKMIAQWAGQNTDDWITVNDVK